LKPSISLEELGWSVPGGPKGLSVHRDLHIQRRSSRPGMDQTEEEEILRKELTWYWEPLCVYTRRGLLGTWRTSRSP
jgi:hypothetical protein